MFLCDSLKFWPFSWCYLCAPLQHRCLIHNCFALSEKTCNLKISMFFFATKGDMKPSSGLSRVRKDPYLRRKRVEVCFLQVVPQALNLLDQEVDVWPGSSRVGDDHTEEVDLVTLWLVANHRSPRLHHHCLDLWGHLLREAYIALLY